MLNIELHLGPNINPFKKWIYIFRGCMHSYFTKCSIVVLERKIFNHFSLYTSMLNIEPLLGSQYLVWESKLLQIRI